MEQETDKKITISLVRFCFFLENIEHEEERKFIKTGGGHVSLLLKLPCGSLVEETRGMDLSMAQGLLSVCVGRLYFIAKCSVIDLLVTILSLLLL